MMNDEDDRPEDVWIGAVGAIPIITDNDPRFVEERAAWSASRRRAQAMHSPDELISGLTDADWRVRHEVVDRLVARTREDLRTVPTLLMALQRDESWEVRDAIAMALVWFPNDPRVEEGLRIALSDSNEEVQWSANFVLVQLGVDQERP